MKWFVNQIFEAIGVLFLVGLGLTCPPLGIYMLLTYNNNPKKPNKAHEELKTD